MLPVDLWRLGTLLLHGAAAGFSPFALPMVVFVNFVFPERWWGALAEGTGAFTVVSAWLPAVAIGTYWLNGLILLLVDTLVRPEVLQQFKIQPGREFDRRKLVDVCKNLAIGQFGVIVPYALFCACLNAKLNAHGWGIELSAEPPSSRRMFLDTLLFILFDEVVFFYSHWALHSKVFGVNLYTRIHKIHHEFSSPIGLVASYSHPVEMLVSNAVPLTFGSLLFRAHAYSLLVWVFFAVLGTQFHHCGYRWPWVVPLEHNPDFHDFHHQKFVCNYGLLGWLDALHGTDRLWQDHLKERRSKPVHPMSVATSVGVVLVAVGTMVSQFAA